MVSLTLTLSLSLSEFYTGFFIEDTHLMRASFDHGNFDLYTYTNKHVLFRL